MSNQNNMRYVPPTVNVHQEPHQTEQRPSFKGQVSDSRVTTFAVLSMLSGGGVGILIWMTNENIVMAVTAGILIILGLFVGLYGYDSLVSTGYLHKRLETGLAIQTLEATTYAAAVNEEQAEQIRRICNALDTLQAKLDMLGTIKVTDQHGTRTVAKYDAVDAAVDKWLQNSIFDANGMLTGIYPQNRQLRDRYPLKGDGDLAQAAHARVMAAGLVGRSPSSKNYIWTGPGIYSEALQKLSSHRGQDRPVVQ